MIDPIQAREFLVRDAMGVGTPVTDGKAEGAGGRSFSDTLADLLNETDELQKSADQTLQDFSTGKVENLHDVMLSMNKADLSFRMLLEVRNKLVDAYTEVMRTQV